MNIGLMGFEFNSPNKGCEALTYSLINILNNMDFIEQGTTIYNFSGSGVGDISNNFDKFNFIEIKPKLKDISFKYIRGIYNCDFVFDVTMGDSFSDIYSENAFNSLIHHKKIAELFCKNYILLPQTYGPFNNKSSEKKAMSVLKKDKKIYCRLVNLDINKKNVLLYLMLGIFFFFGFDIIRKLINYTYFKVYFNTVYDTRTQSSVLKLLVRLSMLLLTLIFSKKLLSEEKSNKYLINLVIWCTLFQVSAVKFYILARLTTYFYVYYILLIPRLIYSNLKKRDNVIIMNILIIIILLLYKSVYYDNSTFGASIGKYKNYYFIWDKTQTD